MKDLSSYYSEQKTAFELELKAINSQLAIVTTIRVISFTAAFVLFYVFSDTAYLALLGFGVPIIILGFFVKRSTELNKKRRIVQNLISIQDRELSALAYDFSKGNVGTDFNVPNHPYALDLGVFGNGSIFQMLTRTVTGGGAKELANQLLNLELQKDKINLRQKSVQELSTKTAWQHQFRANYKNTKGNTDIYFGSVKVFSNQFQKLLYYLLPLGMLSLLALLIMGVIPFTYLLYGAIITLSYTGSFLKKTTAVSGNVEEVLKDISAYRHYIELIENEVFHEVLNKHSQSKLVGDVKASVALEKLRKILNGFDNRNNMLMGVVLNALFLWDVRHLKSFMEWQGHFGDKLPNWLESVHQFDARISIANYVFNNPKNTFPSIVDKDSFYYQAEQLSHPLLKPNSRVPNSILIEGWNQINIITGANMAGKSTFLRTIGASMIMASVGASLPGRLTFTPVALFSSMKTEDSLSDNESYFFAELKRLKQLVDLLELGQPTFTILDEILKGTNSKDKATGSAEFLKKLLRYPLSGIIATHDLSLCKLNSVYPNNISNYAFEVEMNGDELHFDYTLKRGVCQNMNATFLLKQMNLID